jgi:hypothetical protein
MQQARISKSSLPQLKGARLFSFKELQECTNNFSEANDIGSGGYGKVSFGYLLPFLNLQYLISPPLHNIVNIQFVKYFTGLSGSTSNRHNGCH